MSDLNNRSSDNSKSSSAGKENAKMNHTNTTKDAVQGKKVVDGNLVSIAIPRSSHKTAPLIRPKKDVKPPPVATGSSKMFSSGLRHHPSSPTKTKLELKPQGDSADGLDLLDPKSDYWGKTVDIGEIRRKMKDQLNEQVVGVHQKPSFGSSGPLKSITQLDREKATAEKQVELLTSILDHASTHTDDPDAKLKVDGLGPSLLPHQVTGVKFMLKREQVEPNTGGFLFDEMGLGKTVQSIALMLANPPDKKAKGPKSTLIALPLSLVDQWMEEIKQKAPGLTVKKYHGPNRVADFKDYDVVLTTFSLISQEYKEKGEHGPLLLHRWYRIIADEAHTFRNPKSRISNAMAALESPGRRWALTGTPVHNSVEDLYSLFRFVDLKPHSNREIWDRDIGKKNAKELGPNSSATRLLKTYLAVSMMRRKQTILKNVLPPIKREILKFPLNERESGIYQNVLGPSVSGVKKLVGLRLACDGLHMGSESKDDLVDELDLAMKAVKLDDEEERPRDDVDDLTDFMSKASLGAGDDDVGMENCKIQALRKILKSNESPKTVVFTSFVKFFDQITNMLESSNMDYLTYYGSQKISERELTLKRFREDPGKKVLLCSLQCAAVGLNIVCASRVIMMEPWWNPMIVDQAVNRVHRLGQTKPVDVYELCAEDTLEDRMFVVQDRKRRLAKNFVEGGQKLTKEEIQYLIYGGKIPDTLE